MDEIDFTLDGTRYTLTREAVIKSMRHQTAGRIQTWAVDIEGITFPVKQVLAQALGIPAASFISTRAQDLLSKLGFEVINVEADSGPVGECAGGDSSRLDALRLAVELLSARSEASVAQVLEAATSFQSWLNAPET